MKKIFEPQREIDVIQEADVIVVGGGPAGIGAALAAGRNGAKTILIDRFGSLGGLQTQGNNPIFTFVDPELHNGIIQDILTRLEKAGALKNANDLPVYERSRLKPRATAAIGEKNLPKRMRETDVGLWGAWGRTFDKEYYKFLLDDMMQEAGVKMLYHAFAAGAIREGNLLKGVVIEGKEGRKAVLGKVVIDTSGEGDIAWKSGAPVMGDEGVPIGPQKGHAGGMLNAFMIGGVDLKKFKAFREANLEDGWGEMYVGRSLIKKAKEQGAYIIGEACVLASVFDIYNSGRIYVMNAIRSVPEGRKPWMTEEITDTEIDLRKQEWAVLKVLKENVPGFENSFIETTPAIPCIGSGHRLLGDYILNVGDMRAGRAFDDSIAINNMPPDFYEAVGRFAFDVIPHDVPYRSIVSKEVENLLAAGTTMSTGAFAMHGLRYCTPSICTGEAAGTAAALAVKNNVTPKKLDVKLLQDTLRKQGARVTVKDLSEEVLEPYRFIKKLGIKYQREDMKGTEVTEEEIEKY